MLDALIVLGAIGVFYRGTKIGLVRQLCSTAGFFIGLILGAWIGPAIVRHIQGTDARAVAAVFITLGCAFLLLTVGEYIGINIKYKALPKSMQSTDNGFGGLISVISMLIGIWLVSAIIAASPSMPGLQTAIRSSAIINKLDRSLPPAPNVVAKLSHLIDPNGFPDVFIGNEPVPQTPINLPSLGSLADAVKTDRASVVRIKGQGCGGIVSGSGFVVRQGLIATNAHVVAGIRHPYVQDASGSHPATAIWFDPNLDFALLRADVSDRSLDLSGSKAPRGTPAAVLGYPGGGNFSAKPAAVMEELEAAGRNIYGTGHTLRDVYEIQADVVPGNSGGPLVAKDGRVIGIVFAASTDYNHVGYSLTTDRLNNAIDQATSRDQAVGTGACAE